MADRNLYKLMRHIRRLAGAPEAGEHGDGQLLEDFAARRDETAFTTLVERHGPMVLSVCRRVLKDPHGAEDAFQATFLVLARKAGGIARPELLGNWLFGVALRVSRRAKAVLCRQRSREIEGGNMHDFSRASGGCQPPVSPDPSVLLEELERLPAKFRNPLIFLYLQGQTTRETARRLGCPEGTVSSRLARGRDLLRARLERRGVSLSVAALSGGLSADASAAVPAVLVNATVKAATLFAAGKAAAAAAGISSAIVTLTEGALKAMFVTKIKIAAAVLLAVSVAAGGAGVLVHGLQPVGLEPTVKAEAGDHKAQRAQSEPPALPHEAPPPGADSAKPKGDKKPRTDLYGDPLPEGALLRMGTVRFLHEKAVSSIAYSPDGKVLASGSYDNTIRLWDAVTGKENRKLDGHHGRVYSLAYSPDGRTLAASGTGAIRIEERGQGLSEELLGQDKICLWDTATGEEIRRLELEGQNNWVSSVAYSPDGKTLASGDSDSRIRLWDPGTGKEIRRLEGQKGQITSVAFSPDGKTLASGSSDRTIRLWDAATGKEIRQLLLPIKVYSIAFSPDGKILAAGGGGEIENKEADENKTIQLWDPATGKEIQQLEGHQGLVRSVAFSPDGKTLASGSLRILEGEGFGFQVKDGKIRLWDTATGKEIRQIAVKATSVAYSPDGKTLASGSRDMVRDQEKGGENRIRFWDTATGKEIRQLESHQRMVHSVVYSPDGKTLASDGMDNTIRLWDAATGKCKEVRHFKGDFTTVAFTLDLKKLASGSRDKTICLWERATGKKIRLFGGHQGHQGLVDSVAFSPDGKKLASGSRDDKTIRLWETATSKEIRKIGTWAVKSVTFAPDGNSLAGFMDETIFVWDAATGKEIRKFRGNPVFSIAFSPDGKTLASGTMDISEVDVVLQWVERDHTIQLWDMATGKEIRQLRGHKKEVRAVAFSPDGKTIASGGDDEAIRLWDTATGQEIRQIGGHQGGVLSIAFSPDGQRLASGSWDTTILVWDLTRLSETGRPRSGELSPQNLKSLWSDLAGEDLSKTYQAIGTLGAAPAQAVPFLQEQLRPVPAVNPQRLASLVAELDDEQFSVREKASKELEQLGRFAEPALKEKLAGKVDSLELKRRIERLLEKLVSPPQEQLRVLRAVQVLEQLATPEAQEVLKTLAGGAEEARLTQEAKASLERLGKRAAVSP